MRERQTKAAAVLVTGILAGGLAYWLWPGMEALKREGIPAAVIEDSQFHTCSMHPQVVHAGPGQCPICGMTLVPLRPGPAEPLQAEPEGIRVSRGFTQNFSVRTTEAVRGRLRTEIRTVGYLDHDEGKVTSVSTKFPGWIERANVNTIGEKVSEREVLFEVYSPELLTAQKEYLAAVAFVNRLRRGGAVEDAVDRAQSLVGAATERLRHWDLTDGLISELRRNGAASRTVEVRAPVSGYLVAKIADSLVGQRVTPGATVLKIADHSTLWAKVEFHENSVKDVRPGLPAEIALEAYPGRMWRGEVLFFQPAMNPQTQTLTGFVAVENAAGLLRPKMYADVRLRLPGVVNAVIVPAQSVLHTGDRSVVVIAEGEGIFVPREVEIGLESEGRVQVIRGVEPGERVVTSSQFLFDSESNLRTAISQLLERGRDGAPAHTH